MPFRADNHSPSSIHQFEEKYTARAFCDSTIFMFVLRNWINTRKRSSSDRKLSARPPGGTRLLLVFFTLRSDLKLSGGQIEKWRILLHVPSFKKDK